MMLDLSAFSDPNFDPKKWINGSVSGRHPQEGLDKHLVDAEMRLQMAAEEIAAQLEEQSAAALLRVPRATRDVIRLRDDAISLRSSVASILQDLEKAEGSSAESIATLTKIDTVKRRMEAAYETLQDAAGLTQLSSTVEDVFSSGDLPRAAETLANMRHCLSAVGEVAEFANIKRQLEVLEDRLDSMVQPQLTDALTNHKVAVAQDMRKILVRIGRFKSLEMHYTKVHLKPIRELWEDFETRQQSGKLGNEQYGVERGSSGNEVPQNSTAVPFSNWLPTFYDELLLYLEQEWKWCMLAFPEDYKTLVPRLLIEAMVAVGASFVSRVNLATGDAVPETKALAKGILDILSGDLSKGNVQTKHLEALIELHTVTGSFARNIQNLFSDSDIQVLMDTLKAIYLPYEAFKQRYGQMERTVLSSEISAIDLRGASMKLVGIQGVEISETVRRMEESIPQVLMLLEAAVERCINFTGGSEADELVLALDDIMLQYISSLQENLKSLRAVCGVDPNSLVSKKDISERKDGGSQARKVDLASNEEEWSFVQGALQILTVSDCLTSRCSVFEASLRATLSRLSTNLSVSSFGSGLDKNQLHVLGDDGSGEFSMAGKAALDLAVVRLADVPEKARKIFNLLEQSKDPRFHALPVASQRTTAFADAVNELVYDVLISKVRQHFNDVSRLQIWSSVEEKTAYNLPSFSAYPQSYVTNVGEYLLTLPQQLEPLAEGISDSNPDDAQFFATEWMFKVAEGATALYMEQLRGIQYMTDRGAQQLSADIEYLSNVLSALSMPIPTILSTFHTCLSAPKDQLKDMVKSESTDELDIPTAKLVCKMRRVQLEM